MAKYRKIGIAVEASQWFKDGDHPQVMMLNYRWTNVHDHKFCMNCKQKLEVHGWVDTSGDKGFSVCPGSFIIVEKGGHIYYQHSEPFAKNFEKVEHEVNTSLQQLVDLVEAQKEVIAELTRNGVLLCNQNGELLIEQHDLKTLLHRIQSWRGLPGEGINDLFERIAEQFHRDTELLRPGKDCRLHSREERSQAWEAWTETKNDELDVEIARLLE